MLFPDRGYLPFYFVLTMCIASICGEVICRKTQVLVSLALIAALIVGIINVGRITYGYYSNADINKKNIEILSSTGTTGVNAKIPTHPTPAVNKLINITFLCFQSHHIQLI